MQNVRQNIWDMFDGDSKVSSFYDIFMMVVIVASLVPLVFKYDNQVLMWIDYITVTIFIIDYILRWCTADLRLKKNKKSFALYPVTPWAILDLLCILPSFRIIASAFRILKVARLFRTLRVFRSIKLLRNAKSIRIVIDVLRNQWRALLMVLVLAVSYVIVVALVMFSIEPDTFDSFFHAIYWATVTLTTIGYGDVYPHSIAGQAFTIISAFIGIAIIALPSGIIAGGFMDEMHKIQEEGIDNEDTAVPADPQAADPLERIERLGELRDKGLLTEDEFSAKKTDLLSQV